MIAQGYTCYMRSLVFLCVSCSLLAQTSLTLNPEVITHCAPNGLGHLTAVWNYSGPGPVQVRVLSSNGPSMTGPTLPQGNAQSGEWVRDGMMFVLTDAGTQELARATARVQCNFAGEVLPTALAVASYFPLRVGDEWVYLVNSRLITSAYVTRRISRAELVGNTAWFVIEQTVSGEANPQETRFRNDNQGRIYQLTTQGEQIWLDPTAMPDPSAILKVDGRGFDLKTPIGIFHDALSYDRRETLILERGMFARGIGLVTSSQQMLTGSSGGFLQGLDLVYAKIDGHIYYATPSHSIELGVDATDFDVTNQKAPNCAVPCYFVACGFVPGADPPGTYKPCFQARVQFQSASVDLDLLDAASNSVFHLTLASPGDSDSIVFRQVPLYSTPNHPFPTGSYRLRAQTTDGAAAFASIQVR